MSNISGDDEVNSLVRQKHDLLRSFEKKELDETTFNEKLNVITSKIQERNVVLLSKANDQVDKQTEDGNMAKDEAKVKKTPKVEKIEGAETKKRGGGVHANSYTNLILQGLQKKTLKNEEDVAGWVLEQRPGRDKKLVVTHVKQIIYLIKKQSPARWCKYSWDDKDFLLTEK